MTELETLRDHYDGTDQSEALERAEPETAADSDVLVSTSIRLPKALMDRVRAYAAETGVPSTTLMRQWITDRLDNQQPATQVISVADLEQFIATRSRHPATG
jgi:predicted transcriptional regulator